MIRLEHSLQLKFLDLFDNEIINRIEKNFSRTKIFSELLHENCYQAIENCFEDDPKSASASLWLKLRESAMNPVLFECVMKFLFEVDTELHSVILFKNQDIDISSFSKFLQNSSGLLKNLSSLEVVFETLEKMNGLSEIINPIRKRFDEKLLSEEYAKKIILRYIPIMSPNGYERLLFAISKCGPEAESYVNEIFPNFLNHYKYQETHAYSSSFFYHVIGINDTVSEVVNDVFSNGTSPNMFCTRGLKIKKLIQRHCYFDSIEEMPMQLREYQNELIKDACKGQNVIICAPTGSGKTIVAAAILRDHFFKAKMNKVAAKVCFVVPTIALVVQQKILINNYLCNYGRVVGVSGNVGCSGSNSLSLLNAAKNAEIIICTPQLIVNELKNNVDDDQLFFRFSSFISLSDFSMIIFDEAHHTCEKHPYNVIMEIYHEMKDANAFQVNAPQIIGMTASLGCGYSTNCGLPNAIEHTLQICANLDVQNISRVRENVDELMEFATTSCHEIVSIADNLFSSKFFQILNDQLTYFEDKIRFVCNKIENKDLNAFLNIGNDKKQRLKPAYINWINVMKIQVPSIKNLPSQDRELVMLCIEQLMIFYNSILLLRLFNSGESFKYFEVTQIGALTKKKHSDVIILKRVTEDLRALKNSYKSSLLLELIDRVLVFVQTRDFCVRLSSILNECSTFKADFLTGQKSSEAGGQNAASQRMKILKFEKGQTQVLCSTTVAEEGLDISACNLVIEYNNVTNDIAYVQRKGRGRATNAMSVLLALDKEVENKATQNKINEKVMNDVLEKLDELPSFELTAKIQQKIEVFRQDRQCRKALKTKNLQEINMQFFKFSLKCKYCSAFIVYSDHVRLMNESQYVIVDKSIWERITVDELPNYVDYKLISMSTPQIGEYYCANSTYNGCCGRKLGRIILSQDVKMPVISCQSVTFTKTSRDGVELDSTFSVTKWKNVKTRKEPVSILPVQKINLVEMKEAQELHEKKLKKITDSFEIRRKNIVEQINLLQMEN